MSAATEALVMRPDVVAAIRTLMDEGRDSVTLADGTTLRVVAS